MTNLMSMDRPAMDAFFAGLGEKRFRSQQVLQWLYQRNVTEIDQMTDLSKALRQRLSQSAGFSVPEIVNQQLSKDGTCKWLLKLHDGNCIETVFIPEDDRGTLCVSSQVGCSLNCTFCATARQGFSRNLEVDEIIGQVWVANHALEQIAPNKYQSSQEAPGPKRRLHPASISGLATDLQSAQEYADTDSTDQRRPVTNVVMMGMGEPLANFDKVVPAMKLMMDDFTFGLSRRRVTLSTAGMVPAIDRLAGECPVSLAVSLHAANDALRDQLVPLNRKYPIDQLLDACRRYVGNHNRQRITFEYVMLEGVNDSPAHAKQLARILSDVPSKVNLIPFNPFSGIDFKRSSRQTIDRFRDLLLARNIFTVTRRTRGDDIDAACGQLAGEFTDRTRRSERMLRMSQRVVLS